MKLRLSKGSCLLLATASCIVLGGCKKSNNTNKDKLPQDTAKWAKLITEFEKRSLGPSFSTPPKISYLEFTDIDSDGDSDLLVCDCEADSLVCLIKNESGAYAEKAIVNNVAAPARIATGDIDADGDLDIAVAILGQLFPTNDKIGSVLLLEQLGPLSFKSHVLLSETDRVSDVRFGDIDEDGDLDIAVTQFGYDEGKFGWLENMGSFSFEYHLVKALEGGIHGILSDINADGHLDAIVLFSQDLEQIFGFYGDGRGNFSEQLIHQAYTEQFGSSGIWLADLNGDAKLDIFYTNGDAFDYSPPHPWPWHGLQWLENLGEDKFEYHRIVQFGGAVAACPTDWDNDGDIDVFAGSTFNDWSSPDSNSLIYLENDGSGMFTARPVSNSPTHIQCIASDDINSDGYPDLVTGGMHVFEPYDRVQRVQAWLTKPNE